MIGFKAHLDRLEARLQALIEGGLARFFPGSALPHALSEGLMQAMQTGIRLPPGGENRSPEAPNLYRLEAGPGLAQALLSTPGLLDELAASIRQAGAEAGLCFAGPIAMQVLINPQIGPVEFQITALHSLDGLSSTAGLVQTPIGDYQQAYNAFLIVDGTSVFQIERAVTNIGRRTDNHLVIDDVRVSRLHAQLRIAQARYVLFDLDSAGGTWVNGKRISQQILEPGDVISLAGVPLVFGQETPGLDETQEQPIVGGDVA